MISLAQKNLSHQQSDLIYNKNWKSPSDPINDQKEIEK